MIILFYSRLGTQKGEKIQKFLEATAPLSQIETHMSIDSLYQKFRAPTDGPTLFIIVAASPRELSELSSIGDLFYDGRLVLVLPNLEDGTIAMAHRLRPRFVSSMENSFQALESVLKKILREYPDFSR
jgi:hypothetical protein